MNIFLLVSLKYKMQFWCKFRTFSGYSLCSLSCSDVLFKKVWLRSMWLVAWRTTCAYTSYVLANVISCTGKSFLCLIQLLFFIFVLLISVCFNNHLVILTIRSYLIWIKILKFTMYQKMNLVSSSLC